VRFRLTFIRITNPLLRCVILTPPLPHTLYSTSIIRVVLVLDRPPIFRRSMRAPGQGGIWLWLALSASVLLHIPHFWMKGCREHRSQFIQSPRCMFPCSPSPHHRSVVAILITNTSRRGLRFSLSRCSISRASSMSSVVRSQLLLLTRPEGSSQPEIEPAPQDTSNAICSDVVNGQHLPDTTNVTPLADVASNVGSN
jgi:hypothetical protein